MNEENVEQKSEKKKFSPIQIVMMILIVMYLIGGTAAFIIGLVRLANYNLGTDVSATIIKVDYKVDDDGRTAYVVYAYEANGKEIHAKATYRNVKLEKNSYTYPYYEGKEESIKISKNDEGKVVMFSTAEILAIVFGAFFDVIAILLLYFGFLKKPSVSALIDDYTKAIYNENREAGLDDTGKNEVHADELNKFSHRSAKHMFGMAGVWKKRLSDNLKTTSVLGHIFNILYISLIISWAVIDEVVIRSYHGFGSLILNILIWLFLGVIAWALVTIIFRIMFNLWLKISIKRKRFSEKKIAEVVCSSFLSEHQIRIGEFGKNNVLKRTFKVIATIDGKRCKGYVSGLVPPPKGTRLKVLVKPNSHRLFILDTEQK